MKRFAALAVSVVAVAGLVGCGGGGGDDVVGSPSGLSAEGYYAGGLRVTAFPAVVGNPAIPNTSTAFQMLVLESGEFWTFYGKPNGASLDIEGFAQGTGTSNGALFTAGGVRYFPAPPDLGTNAVASASYNASARSISGTITDASTTATFNSVALVAPAYNYASAASLASLTGAWTVRGPANDEYTLNVAAGGSFTATPTAVSGCSFSGTFVPRTTGKNVFNVSVTNGGNPCTLENLVSTGVAYLTPAGAQVQLTFATVSADRQLGAVVSGLR